MFDALPKMTTEDAIQPLMLAQVGKLDETVSALPQEYQAMILSHVVACEVMGRTTDSIRLALTATVIQVAAAIQRDRAERVRNG